MNFFTVKDGIIHENSAKCKWGGEIGKHGQEILSEGERLGSLTPPNLKNAAKPLQAYIFVSNFMLLYIGFLVFLWYNRRWR